MAHQDHIAAQRTSAPRSGARKLARGMRLLRTLEYVNNSGIRTLKGCRGVLAPFPGCGCSGFQTTGGCARSRSLNPRL